MLLRPGWIIVGVVIVVVVIVTLAVVLTRSSNSNSASPTGSPIVPSGSPIVPSGSPIGPGPPNRHDLNVEFVAPTDLEVDVESDYTLAMISNNIIKTLPKTTDFDPAAKEVKSTGDNSFTITFVFSVAGTTHVTLTKDTVTDEYGNQNETDTTSVEITVVDPNPPPPVPTDDWEGLASTTVFGNGDGPWGNKPGFQISLDAVNSEASHRMGAAVPWRVLCKQFGTKENQIEQTVNSALGKNEDKACWVIQPVSKYMNEVKGSTDPNFNNDIINGICQGDSCVDVNSDIGARDGTGNEFPAYLIVGFEG